MGTGRVRIRIFFFRAQGCSKKAVLNFGTIYFTAAATLARARDDRLDAVGEALSLEIAPSARRILIFRVDAHQRFQPCDDDVQFINVRAGDAPPSILSNWLDFRNWRERNAAIDHGSFEIDYFEDSAGPARDAVNSDSRQCVRERPGPDLERQRQ
jgi:hypothetical protein